VREGCPMTKHSPRVGIIAEDESDVDAAKVLIRRISGKENISVKRFVGKGCGRIKRKSLSWANTLKSKGCKYLILIHDLDRKDINELRAGLESAISISPISPYLICIPVEEMESWWLADPDAIRKALKLRKAPKVKDQPQSITSPKEHIGDLVRKCSNNTKIYLNTEHNKTIAMHLDICKARKMCDSFEPLFKFVTEFMG
jgi:hypothetical protein